MIATDVIGALPKAFRSVQTTADDRDLVWIQRGATD
jgi:hypothetical protein